MVITEQVQEKEQGKINIYYDYLKGKISREKFLEYIPERLLQSVICETMSNETLPGLFERIDKSMKEQGISHVDVIIGGPPCQAYSLVGRAQSSHMKVPMNEDPRNDLYKLYARFLKKYQPEMFVFENVMGIETANGGETWKKIKAQLRRVGYEIEPKEQNARAFGVLQNRRRMIIVGWKKGTNFSYPKFQDRTSDAFVEDLLNDLPKLVPGGGKDISNYRSGEYSDYLRTMKLRSDDDVLTLHRARPNKERDIEIYKKAIEAWNDGKGSRLNYNSLPEELKTHKNRHSFVDRFKVVEGKDHYCHTMLAHISIK